MALGIGLVAPPGPDGRPMMQYLIDVRFVCGACGHGQQVRYYREVLFHSLTLRRLEVLLERAVGDVEEVCEQCEASITGEDAEVWSLSVGVAESPGVLQGFVAGGEAVWSLRPHDAYDVQMLARFEPVEDIASVVVPELSEELCLRVFGRAFNPKAALRAELARWSGREALTLGLAPGLCVRVLPAGVRAIEEASGACSVVLVDSGVPSSGWPAAPAEWLVGLEERLAGARVVARVEEAPIRDALQRHLDGFPIDTELIEPEEGVVEAVAGDGSDHGSRIRFAMGEVALEAARTCVAPGDMARIEFDRALVMLQMTEGDLL